MDAELTKLLAEHKGYFTVQEDGRLKCEINGHQFPPRADVLSTFIKGPKFQKLKKRYDAEHALDKHAPLIVQSKNFPHMLYCAVTGQLMDKSLEAVTRHMEGKKFKSGKARYERDPSTLRPEPNIDDLIVELSGRQVKKNKAPAAAAAEGAEGAAEDAEGAPEDATADEQPQSKKARTDTNGQAGASTAGAGAGGKAGKQQEKGAGVASEGKVSKDKGQKQRDKQKQKQATQEAPEDADMDEAGEGGDDDDDDGAELWVPEGFEDLEARAAAGELDDDSGDEDEACEDEDEDEEMEEAGEDSGSDFEFEDAPEAAPAHQPSKAGGKKAAAAPAAPAAKQQHSKPQAKASKAGGGKAGKQQEQQQQHHHNRKQQTTEQPAGRSGSRKGKHGK